MYGFDHGGWMFGGGLWMLFSWLLPVVLVVIVVAAIYAFARPGRGTRQNTALDILNERYARGEIDKQEFEQKKRDIGG